MAEELRWETQADWDSAQHRERVVTRDLGSRTGETYRQGYDPEHPLVNEAVSYWHFDDSGATVEDAIGGANGTVRGAQPGATGILGSTAYRFDGIDDRIDVDSMPLASPSNSWTANLWVNRDTENNFNILFALEDSANGEYLGLGVWNNNNSKIYSSGRTPGEGAQFPVGEWTMATLRWNGQTEVASLFVNGQFDYDVAPSGGGGPFANADQLTIGDRRVSSSNPPNGRIDEPLLFPRALSDSEISALHDVGSSGELTTAPQTVTGQATSIAIDGTVPTNTEYFLRIHQDTTGDGASNNRASGTFTSTGTLSIADDAFEDVESDYWIETELSTTDTEQTAVIDSYTLTVETVASGEIKFAQLTGRASSAGTVAPLRARTTALVGQATGLVTGSGNYGEEYGVSYSRAYVNPLARRVRYSETNGRATGESAAQLSIIYRPTLAGQATGEGTVTPTRSILSAVNGDASGTSVALPSRGRYSELDAQATATSSVEGMRLVGALIEGAATGASSAMARRIARAMLNGTAIGEGEIMPTRSIPGATSGDASGTSAALPHRGRYSTAMYDATTTSSAMPSRGRYSELNAQASGAGTYAAGVIRGGFIDGQGVGAGAISLTIVVPEVDTRHWGAGVSPAGVTPFGIGRRPGTDFQPTAYTIVLDNAARRDDPQDLGVSRTVLTDQTFSSLDATRRHTAMGDFVITVPGRKDLHNLTGAEAYIYHRGDLIFRGRFESSSHTRSTNLTTLEGMGVGIALEDGQAYTTYENIPAVDALRDYWDQHTQFDVDIYDPPVSTVFEDQTVSRVEGQSAMQSVLEPTETEPVTVEGGEVKLEQSCFPIDGLEYTDRGNDDRDHSDGTSIEDSQFYSGGQAVHLTNVGDYVEYEFSPNYQIPQIRIRTRLGGQDKPEVTASLDGQEVGLAMTAMGNRFPQPEWSELRLFGETLRNIGGERGQTYTLRLEVTREDPVFDGGHAAVDMVAPFDLRYNYDWPVDVEDDGHLRGPQAFPDEYAVTPEAIETTSNITRAAITSTWDDTSGNQEIALSNDDQSSFEPEGNTDAVDITFSSFGYSITPRFTLSRYGERTGESPKEGFRTQVLSGWKIRADGNDLAIIADEDYFGTHLENLQDLHEKAGLWFTLKHDPTALEAISFPPNESALHTEFPIPERDWEDIDSEKSDSGYYNRVVVQGRRRSDGSRRIVTRQNDKEIWARGGNPEDPDDPTGVKTFRHVDPRLATMDDVRAKAASLLATLSAGRTLSGSISAEPQMIDPGISYAVDPWDRHVPLDEVSYADGVGTSDGSYDFTEDDGLAARLARLRADAKTIQDLL